MTLSNWEIIDSFFLYFLKECPLKNISTKIYVQIFQIIQRGYSHLIKDVKVTG